jgi:hypothetical protein
MQPDFPVEQWDRFPVVDSQVAPQGHLALELLQDRSQECPVVPVRMELPVQNQAVPLVVDPDYWLEIG